MVTGVVALPLCCHGNHRFGFLNSHSHVYCCTLLVHVTSQCSCCYGNLQLLLSSLFHFSILEHVTSESTLCGGSDPLAPSQAAKEKEKGLFEDRKVCACMCACVGYNLAEG